MKLVGLVLDEQRQFAPKFDPWFGETAGRGKLYSRRSARWRARSGGKSTGAWWRSLCSARTLARTSITHRMLRKSKVYRVRVDPRSKTYRQRELDQALPKIQDALLAGQDVIFHCVQSFHRAPVTAAAAYRRVTGGSASVHTCCMAAVVAAASQIKFF